MGVILARAPLRISFGGGGTDLPSYYRQHGGFVVSAAIDKHVHMLVSTEFHDRYLLKHLEWEEVDEPQEVRHPILRVALDRHWNGTPLEMASVADVPAGTGLGSSGAYTVCTLKALRLAGGRDCGPEELAEDACEVELDVLRRTVGKQDQYVAAHGGINALTFRPDDSVEVRPLRLGPGVREALETTFLLFYTGQRRSASEMFSDEVRRTLAGDEDAKGQLHRTKELALESCAALESGDLDRLTELMNAHWEVKRARSPGATNERLEDLRATALRAGAGGVMLMGAGGGGFILVHAPDPEPVRAALAQANAVDLPFQLDERGCVGWPGPAA